MGTAVVSFSVLTGISCELNQWEWNKRFKRFSEWLDGLFFWWGYSLLSFLKFCNISATSELSVPPIHAFRLYILPHNYNPI